MARKTRNSSPAVLSPVLSPPPLLEPYMRDARQYVQLAARRSGPNREGKRFGTRVEMPVVHTLVLRWEEEKCQN